MEKPRGKALSFFQEKLLNPSVLLRVQNRSRKLTRDARATRQGVFSMQQRGVETDIPEKV